MCYAHLGKKSSLLKTYVLSSSNKTNSHEEISVSCKGWLTSDTVQDNALASQFVTRHHRIMTVRATLGNFIIDFVQTMRLSIPWTREILTYLFLFTKVEQDTVATKHQLRRITVRRTLIEGWGYDLSLHLEKEVFLSCIVHFPLRSHLHS